MLDPSSTEIFRLYGPILHPWTFQIRKEDVEYGQISKKWSGLLKEGFTDTDNFGVVFLIDFVHFEN